MFQMIKFASQVTLHFLIFYQGSAMMWIAVVDSLLIVSYKNYQTLAFLKKENLTIFFLGRGADSGRSCHLPATEIN